MIRGGVTGVSIISLSHVQCVICEVLCTVAGLASLVLLCLCLSLQSLSLLLYYIHLYSPATRKQAKDKCKHTYNMCRYRREDYTVGIIENIGRISVSLFDRGNEYCYLNSMMWSTDWWTVQRCVANECVNFEEKQVSLEPRRDATKTTLGLAITLTFDLWPWRCFQQSSHIVNIVPSSSENRPLRTKMPRHAKYQLTDGRRDDPKTPCISCSICCWPWRHTNHRSE